MSTRDEHAVSQRKTQPQTGDAVAITPNHDTVDDDSRDSFKSFTVPRSTSSKVPPVVPKLNSTYGSHDYWEDRFENEDSFEWLLSYEQLAAQIEPHLLPVSRILVVGCGNAPFSADLYDAGYHNIVNVDYSETVIANMQQRHLTERPQMEWLVMDMTDLSALMDASFDVVIDKAAMDAIMTKEVDVWNPHASVVRASRDMCRHISRILRPDGGVFLQISLAQPHFRKRYLLAWHGNPGADEADDSYAADFGWTYRAEAAGRPESSAGMFGHFLYVMIKSTRPVTST
jgi:SAM-dependent methyltransferase